MDSWIDDELMRAILTKGIPPIPGKPSSTGAFTTDGRPCQSMCDDGATPNDAKEEPEIEDQETTKGEAEEIIKEKEKEKKVKEETAAIDGGSTEATCSLTLASEQFAAAKSGSKKRIACPPGCLSIQSAIVVGPAPMNEHLQIAEA